MAWGSCGTVAMCNCPLISRKYVVHHMDARAPLTRALTKPKPVHCAVTGVMNHIYYCNVRMHRLEQPDFAVHTVVS